MNFFITILLLTSSFLLGMEERPLVKPSATAAKIEKWANKAAGLESYHHPEIERLPSEKFLPSEFRAYCPNPLPKPHERLTNAMFLSLPAVQELQKLDITSKNKQLKKFYNVCGGDFIYYAQRCASAACIAAGADSNYSRYKSRKFESSWLYRATLMQDFRLVQFLLEQRANPNQKDSYSEEHSLFLAQNKYMAKLLCAYGAQLHTDLLYKAMWHNRTPKLLAWYLKKGLDPNARKCSFYCIPLHYLASSYESLDKTISPQKIKLLLDAGAKIDIKNDHGETFLDRVKKTQSQDIYDFFNNLITTYEPQPLYTRLANKGLEKAKDKEAVCSICLGSLEAPCIATCCKQLFCAACILQWWECKKNRPCPTNCNQYTKQQAIAVLLETGKPI